MSKPAFRIQVTDRQSRERRIVGALFPNEKGIKGSLSLVLDKDQATGQRPTSLTLDTATSYVDFLPVTERPAGNRPPPARRPAAGPAPSDQEDL